MSLRIGSNGYELMGNRIWLGFEWVGLNRMGFGFGHEIEERKCELKHGLEEKENIVILPPIIITLITITY